MALGRVLFGVASTISYFALEYGFERLHQWLQPKPKVNEDPGPLFGLFILIPVFGLLAMCLALAETKLPIVLLITALALPILVFLVGAFRIIGFLHDRGYGWITITDGIRLYAELGRKLHRLPPRKELLVIPDYKDMDVESLARVVNALADGNESNKAKGKDSK